MIKLLLTTTIMMFSFEAFGLVDVGAKYGVRWYEHDGSGTAFTGYTLDAHVDVLPMLAVGLNASQFKIVSRDTQIYDNQNIFEVGLDALVTVPLIPIITPYARLQLNIVQKISSDGTNYLTSGTAVKEEVEASGSFGDHSVALGIEFSPLPLVGITLEAIQGVQMTTIDSSKQGGQDNKNQYPKGAVASNLQAVMLGVRVNL